MLATAIPEVRLMLMLKNSSALMLMRHSAQLDRVRRDQKPQ